MGMSEQALKDIITRMKTRGQDVTALEAQLRGSGPVHKYGAVSVTADGMRFDSTSECRRYLQLKLLQQSGEVVFFLRQTPFHFPGGGSYRADFQIFWADSRVTFEDVKGAETSDFTSKMQLIAAHYPQVTIELVDARPPKKTEQKARDLEQLVKAAMSEGRRRGSVRPGDALQATVR